MTTPNELKTNYDDLTPDTVLDAIESQGFLTDARIVALNSYENRVYQIGLEGKEPIIAKFYRPQRWSNEQILEEHKFSWQLADAEIPVVPPIRNDNGDTLFEYEGYRFSLFTRRGGQSPEPGDLDQLFRLGRLLGRIHIIGAQNEFQHRPTLNIKTYGEEPAELVLTGGFVPAHLADSMERVSTSLLEQISNALSNTNALKYVRCHGDCHIGNILWHRDLGPAFVDMDDCINAPAIQDLWMLLEGERHQKSLQISEIIEGYSEFMDFNSAELQLVEPLRALRMIHYAGWLAKRWDDPAFPMHFPWFNTESYWSQHLAALEEQLLILEEPPLTQY